MQLAAQQCSSQWQVVLQISTSKIAAAHLLQRKPAVAVLFLTLFAEEEENRPKKRNRKQYVRDWIALREERGIYHQLVKELEVEDHAAYQDFFRLTGSSPTSAMFVYVLHARARARAQLAGKIHKPITGVFSRFVAWQLAVVVVIRAKNAKFVAKSRSQVHFVQHVVATYNICDEFVARQVVQVGGSTCNNTFQLATLHCCAKYCPLYFTLTAALNDDYVSVCVSYNETCNPSTFMLGKLPGLDIY